MGVIPLQRHVEYPESDGRPMAETEFHLEEMIDLIKALKDHFRALPEVYVGGNMCFYYVEGQPRFLVAPDVFVVRGVAKGRRRVYKLWEEGRPPCCVIEVTSDSTRNEDLVEKKSLYERLGVEEYFLHDPLGDYLKPRLQGYRLVAGRYQKVQPGEDGALHSRTLGLTFRQDGDGLRLIDTATGEPLLRVEEAQALARRERQARKAQQEAEQRAQAAEAELAHLRAELERLRND